MFADMPLDNHTVDQIAALAAEWLSPSLLETSPQRNDLKFRHGIAFCNIEPKIRQYG
jgi:hypothetical protein